MNKCNSRCCNRNCRCSSRCFPINSNCMNNDSNMFANICQNTKNVFPENYLYGHAYTPVQTLNNTYNPEMGLECGSIFPELISPYSPGQSIDFIEFLRNGGRCDE